MTGDYCCHLIEAIAVHAIEEYDTPEGVEQHKAEGCKSWNWPQKCYQQPKNRIFYSLKDIIISLMLKQLIMGVVMLKQKNFNNTYLQDWFNR